MQAVQAVPRSNLAPSASVGTSQQKPLTPFPDILKAASDIPHQTAPDGTPMPYILGVVPGTNGGINIEDVRAQSEVNLAYFRKAFRTACLERGIDLTQAAELETGPEGLTVCKDHPDKAKIEQLFMERPDLQQMFSETMAGFTFVHLGEEASAFAHAYARDPVAAVAQFHYFWETDLIARMKIDAQSASVLFRRVPKMGD